jgi:hypothetical protein
MFIPQLSKYIGQSNSPTFIFEPNPSFSHEIDVKILFVPLTLFLHHLNIGQLQKGNQLTTKTV